MTLANSELSLYADDIALILSKTSQIELMLTLKVELDTVTEWLHANILTANIKKTSVHNLRESFDFNLGINRGKIKKVQSMKYLGVILDDELNFDENISTVHSKVVKKVGLLRNLLLL